MPLAVRVSLRTGLVVVGARGAEERQAHRALRCPRGATVAGAPGSEEPLGTDGALLPPREGYGWTPRKTCFKIPIRLARAAMEAAIQYAKERETFGTKIGNSQRLVITRHLLGLA